MKQTSLGKKMEISNHQAKYLGEVIELNEKRVKEKEGPFIRYAARSEAAYMLLCVNGFNYDFVTNKVYTEKGNVRTYLE